MREDENTVGEGVRKIESRARFSAA